MAGQHKGRRKRVALQANALRVAEVGGEGDRAHAAGEQLQHGNVQVDEPLERKGDVPVQTVAEPTDARRLAVGGGVCRDHIFDREVRWCDPVVAAQHHRDGRPARVDKRVRRSLFT